MLVNMTKKLRVPYMKSYKGSKSRDGSVSIETVVNNLGNKNVSSQSFADTRHRHFMCSARFLTYNGFRNYETKAHEHCWIVGLWIQFETLRNDYWANAYKLVSKSAIILLLGPHPYLVSQCIVTEYRRSVKPLHHRFDTEFCQSCQNILFATSDRHKYRLNIFSSHYSIISWQTTIMFHIKEILRGDVDFLPDRRLNIFFR
jgi:hypothetical protein